MKVFAYDEPLDYAPWKINSRRKEPLVRGSEPKDTLDDVLYLAHDLHIGRVVMEVPGNGHRLPKRLTHGSNHQNLYSHGPPNRRPDGHRYTGDRIPVLEEDSGLNTLLESYGFGERERNFIVEVYGVSFIRGVMGGLQQADINLPKKPNLLILVLEVFNNSHRYKQVVKNPPVKQNPLQHRVEEAHSYLVNKYLRGEDVKPPAPFYVTI